MAIGTPTRVVGANGHSAGSTSLTTAAVSIAAGLTVFVLFVVDNVTGSITCVDSGGVNTYTANADVNAGGAAQATCRIVLFSCPNIAGLSSKTFTVSHPSAQSRAMIVVSLSGLVTSSILDVGGATTAKTGLGNNDPDSVSTGTLAQADEFILGILGVEGTTRTLTVDADWTAITPEGSTGGTELTNVQLFPLYQIVSSTGALTYNDSLANALSAVSDWACAVCTYKGEVVAAGGKPWLHYATQMSA